MGEYRDKIIAGLLIFATLAFLFIRTSSQPIVSSGDGSTAFANLSLAESQKMFSDLGGEVANPPVIVFVTSWCPMCRALEKELTGLAIPYLAVDVEENQRAQEYYRQLLAGRRGGVPLTVVGDTVVLGVRLQPIQAAYQRLVTS